MSASDLALSAGLRSNLLLLQSVDQKMARSQERLSTGLKINTALDSPPAYFAAKGLTNKASDLMGLKDAMGQAISTVKAGTKGIDSIQSLVDQARGLTTAAMAAMGTDSASITTRQSFAKRFDEIMDAINGVGDDSGYGGKNLLKGNGYRIDPTPESKLAVDNLPGIGNARVTNMKSEDSYRVEVLGTGAVTGNPSDIANAEQNRGVAPIVVTGAQSGTQGNFNPITVEVKGPVGRDKQITVGNPPETATYAFTQDQWKTAKAAGQSLKLDHTFGSGARISFPVNFDQIEGAQPNAGQGVSAIEKHVDLQVKVTNRQDLSVVRDVNASAGNARLTNGENSFVFPSGTVRLNVDPAKIVTETDYFDGGDGELEGLAFDKNGFPIYHAVGVDPKTAYADMPLAKSSAVFYQLGLPDSASLGFRNLYVRDNYGATSIVSAPNSKTEDFKVTLGGAGPNVGKTISLNINEYNPSHAYHANSLDSQVPNGEVVSGSSQQIAIDEPILQNDGSSLGGYGLLQWPIKIDGMPVGKNMKLEGTWGGVNSAGPGMLNFSLKDMDGNSYETEMSNNFVGSIKIPMKKTDGSIAYNIEINVNNFSINYWSVTSTSTHDVKVIWPRGSRPSGADLVTKDSNPPGTANDLSVAFDVAQTNDLTVQSQNLQVSGQGLQVDYSQNGWCDQADIEEAAKGLDTASQRIRSAAQALNTGMNVITTRDTFTKEFSNVLEEGANKLTLADQNEEGSNVLMLQTRKQLGMTALSLAAKSQQTILSLFA